MLAICSDLDETPDSGAYISVARFLNTTSETPLGRGVGLEVGNTIYFDMPNDQFAYWNTDDASRELVRNMIRSGHIDCFHSFGDLAKTRGHAERALEELERHGCRIECWIDHSKAPTNVGPDIMMGTGDVPGSPAYHTDLTYAHGVRFFWRGRVTSVIGQNRDRSLRRLFSLRNPLVSARTMATEAMKGALAGMGSRKYAMHGINDVIRPITLRDARPVFEFMRCNPYWGGVSRAETADGLADVLTDSFLKRLVERQGVCILYTHLGKSRNPTIPLTQGTITALRRLLDAADRCDVLVATTRRLLGYCLTAQHVAAEVIDDGGREIVRLDTTALKLHDVSCDLSGITICVKDSVNARLFVDGTEAVDIQRNPEDELGCQSISVPWRPLSFPNV